MGEDRSEALLPFLFIEIFETGEEMAGTRANITHQVGLKHASCHMRPKV